MGETYPPISADGIEPYNTLIQIYDYAGQTNYASYGLGAQTDDGTYPYWGPQPPSTGGFYPGFEATNYCMETFNGSTESRAYAPALNLNTNAVTITMWINPVANAIFGNEGLFVWGNGNDKAGLAFGGKQDANLVAELGYIWNSNSAASYNWDSGLYPPRGYWSFVALTITPTNSTVYLMYATESVTNAFKSVNTISNTWERFSGGTTWIGSDSYDGRDFGGMIDEVAVFNQSLSESRLQSLFLTSLGSPAGVAPSFVQQPTPSLVVGLQGQILQFKANAGGIPSPAYQWQYRAKGSSAPFVDLNGVTGVAGSQSNILSVTLSTPWEMQCVATNIIGKVTSATATLNVIVPDVPQWTLNFQYTNNGACWATTPQWVGLGPYTGHGVVGNQSVPEFWNSIANTNPEPGFWVGPKYSQTNTFLEDGVTHSGQGGKSDITATVLTGGDFSCFPYATNSDDIQTINCMYAQMYVATNNGVPIGLVRGALVFSNCPSGKYQMVCYSCCAIWVNRGTTFVCQGQTNSAVNAQFQAFIFNDNCVLFQNIYPAADGTISVDIAPDGMVPGGNGGGLYGLYYGEGQFNGAQLQYIGGGVPSPLTNYWDGTHLNLKLVGRHALFDHESLNGTVDCSPRRLLALPGSAYGSGGVLQVATVTEISGLRLQWPGRRKQMTAGASCPGFYFASPLKKGAKPGLTTLRQNPARIDFLVNRCRRHAGQKFSFGQNADHRRVVRAKAFFRKTQSETFALARAGEFAAQGAIAGDAAGGGHTTDAVSFRGADGFLHEHFDNRRLNAGAQITQLLRVIQNPRVIAEKIAHGGFQAAEAEVVAGVIQQRAREVIRLGIPLLRQPVNFRSGGIRQPHQFAGLVETFARRVIHRARRARDVSTPIPPARASCARR